MRGGKKPTHDLNVPMHLIAGPRLFHARHGVESADDEAHRGAVERRRAAAHGDDVRLDAVDPLDEHLKGSVGHLELHGDCGGRVSERAQARVKVGWVGGWVQGVGW